MAFNEIRRLLLQNAAFTPPMHIASAVPENIRTPRIATAPHCIAEELWHIAQGSYLRDTTRSSNALSLKPCAT